MIFRARPVAEKTYGVFLDRIEGIDPNGEHSPIDLVRIEYKIFIEKLGEYADSMKSECRDQLSGWLSLADRLDARDLMEAYIDNKISEIFIDLFERSVDRAGGVIAGYKALGFRAILTSVDDE